MKIKTSELTGAALSWAVAKCEGHTIRKDPMAFGDGSYWIWEETASGLGGVLIEKSVYMRVGRQYDPTSNWSQGGPIIEREKISIGTALDSGYWLATNSQHPSGRYNQNGPTPLIAALRCYVSSKLGDEIEIPKELFE
ncbi:MAG TPA: DUF2591 domain-containing protein [Methanosarcina sp.]|nr:DUF2591 domain-containing protein [Methanosarcina sp.]